MRNAVMFAWVVPLVVIFPAAARAAPLPTTQSINKPVLPDTDCPPGYVRDAAALEASGGNAKAVPCEPVSKLTKETGASEDNPTTIAAFPEKSAPGLTQALAATGKLNTFMEIVKVAGFEDPGLRSSKAEIQDDTVRSNTSFENLGLRGKMTIFAPNDAAFAAMDKAKLAALMKDPAAARAFVMSHVVDQPLTVNDMFHPDNPTSEKLFKSARGDEFKLLCDGRAHVGLHHPRINGKAKVADIQDVSFNGGFVQEIDAILAE